jgi:hypothetical protein
MWLGGPARVARLSGGWGNARVVGNDAAHGGFVGLVWARDPLAQGTSSVYEGQHEG